MRAINKCKIIQLSLWTTSPVLCCHCLSSYNLTAGYKIKNV